MTNLLITVISASVALVVGILAGRWWHARRVRQRIGSAEDEASSLLEEARREAKNIRREAELEGKEEAYQLKIKWEEEAQERRTELTEMERRLGEREERLERKLAQLDERQERQEERREKLEQRTAELEEREQEVAEREAEAREQLEELAGLTADEARDRLVSRIEDEAKADAAQHAREVLEDARRDAEREARKIISLAIEKVAVDHASEATVSVVSLPSDDMKGRIIGREGRNIRSFEAATGVDVVVDDTPEAVILSCFDPIRREVARVAMERLVADGRIHPGRIEELVEKAREEVEESIPEAAEEVLYELGIHDLHPYLVELLGKLRFRTSYGQNQLQHAREVALVAANMAAELGLDVEMTKRMGILHDVGKALSHEHEGSHVELGYEVASQHGEPDQVLNAIRAHHDEAPARYPESFLITAADAISGARPGARRESFEHYVKRLEKLERLAASYEGVEKVYAIQAGREIRIMVMPGEVTDAEMETLSEKTARRIEEELQYPGQIKVVVVRETRSVDFAR
jgi:ribonuclease Y